MKATNPTPPPVGGSPIQNVLLVGRIEKRVKGYTFQATSLPGHLLHLVLSGRVRQQCNGRAYELRPGAVMWYHEDEWVTGTAFEVPWVFYTVNFIAPCLPPPSFESRLLFPRLAEVRPAFEALYRDWHDSSLPAPAREFRVQAALLRILAALQAHVRGDQHVRMDPRARLWWEIETRARQQLDQPVSLPLMEEWTGASAATIARSCRHAVGVPPMKRVKTIRMSLARGLVRSSELSMKEIAERLGYDRVHEFSRDYRKYHGLPATEDRLKA